jgi:hypothetical protein
MFRASVLGVCVSLELVSALGTQLSNSVLNVF